MIVLDTNVLSELMRLERHLAFDRWMLSQDSDSLFTTAMSQAEILSGIALLPEGKRRSALTLAADRTFSKTFSGRVLPFDGASAEEYAALWAERRQSGRPISIFDAQIAAIARSREAILATRNLKDFRGSKLVLVNPWDDAP